MIKRIIYLFLVLLIASFGSGYAQYLQDAGSIQGVEVTTDAATNDYILVYDSSTGTILWEVVVPSVNSIDSTHIKDGSIISADIKNGGVANADLAADAVDSTKVADGSLISADLKTGAVENADLAANAVDSSKVADGSLITADLKDSLVTGQKVVSSTLTNTHQANADWGDFSVSSNSATLDADVVGTDEMANADHGDFTYSGGSATLDADVVSTDEMANADHGDFTYSGGSATLDNDVVAAAEMADADHGDISWTSGVASIDDDVVVKADFGDEDWGDMSVSTNAVTVDAYAFGGDEIDSNAQVSMIMTDADTLAAGVQSDVDSLGGTVASIELINSNQYGSNSASVTRKNWGMIHYSDGAAGMHKSCGFSARVQGDSSFVAHWLVGGVHSSGLKIGMEGVAATHHRGVNILMPAYGSQATQAGILVRDNGSVGDCLELTKYGDGGYGIFVEADVYDTSSTPDGNHDIRSSAIPIYIENHGDSTSMYIDVDEKAIVSDSVPAHKKIIVINADTTNDDYNVQAAIYMKGTSFNSAADAQFMIEVSDGSYWVFGVDPTDAYKWKWFFKKSGGSLSLKASLDTLGNFTDEF